MADGPPVTVALGKDTESRSHGIRNECKTPHIEICTCTLHPHGVQTLT